MGSRDYVDGHRPMTIRELEELLRRFWGDKDDDEPKKSWDDLMGN